MDLQTKVALKKYEAPIDYDSKIIMLGSCFSQNIGEKLDYFKFNNLVNPFGVLFHPVAIQTLLKRVVTSQFYTEDDLVQNNELWHCFDVHSQFSQSTKEGLLFQLNETLSNTKLFLETATHITITLGTAWVYRLLKTDTIVANCHKVPQKAFNKVLLTVTEVEDSLTAIIDSIASFNPSCKVLFTVSPVRHIKDGFIENTQSKSHLLTAIHKVINKETNTSYFPSYEIMMDELRDYRFYNNDMLHPSALAVNYIWERFTENNVSESAKVIMKKVEVVQRGLLHRPFNPNTEAHQVFLDKLSVKKDWLIKNYSHIQF